MSIIECVDYVKVDRISTTDNYLYVTLGCQDRAWLLLILFYAKYFKKQELEKYFELTKMALVPNVDGFLKPFFLWVVYRAVASLARLGISYHN